MTIKTSNDVEAFFPFSQWLFVISTAMPLAVYAYLGIFSRHMADDFCVAFKRPNFFVALWNNYLNISDRYSNFILISLTESISPRSISVLPGLMILLWVIGVMWFLHEATRIAGAIWKKPVILSLALLVSFLALLQAPNLYQTLYWRSSMATHFAPLVFLPFFASFLLRCISGRIRPTLWLYLLTFLLGLFLGGFSEPVVLLILVLLTCSTLIIWKIFGHGPQLNFLLLAFFGALAALCIMLLAPANSLRLNTPPPGILDLVSRSFLYAFQFISNTFNILPLPVFFTVVIPLIIFYNIYSFSISEINANQKKYLMLAMAFVPVFVYLLIVSSFAPSVYGQSFPVERARFSGQLCLVLGLIIEGSLLGILLAQWRPFFLKQFPVRLILTCLILIGAFYPLRAALISFRQIPEYQTRAEFWDLRDKYIKRHIAAGERDIVVPLYPGVFGIKELDDDPMHWVNICAAEYYGVNSIRAVSVPKEYLLDALNE